MNESHVTIMNARNDLWFLDKKNSTKFTLYSDISMFKDISGTIISDKII